MVIVVDRQSNIRQTLGEAKQFAGDDYVRRPEMNIINCGHIADPEENMVKVRLCVY